MYIHSCKGFSYDFIVYNLYGFICLTVCFTNVYHLGGIAYGEIGQGQIQFHESSNAVEYHLTTSNDFFSATQGFQTGNTNGATILDGNWGMNGATRIVPPASRWLSIRTANVLTSWLPRSSKSVPASWPVRTPLPKWAMRFLSPRSLSARASTTSSSCPDAVVSPLVLLVRLPC